MFLLSRTRLMIAVTFFGFGALPSVAAPIGTVYWSESRPHSGPSHPEQLIRATLNSSGAVTDIELLVSDEPGGFLSFGWSSIAVDTEAEKMFTTYPNTTTNNPVLAISRWNLDGTGKEDIVSYNTITAEGSLTVTSSQGIAVDVDVGKIYWAQSDSSRPAVYQADAQGTPAAVVASISTIVDEAGLAALGGGVPVDLAIDVSATPTKVYWLNPTVSAIQRADEDGANFENVLTGVTADYFDLDLTAGKIYWYQSAGDGTFHRANLDGSSPETLAVTDQFTREIKVDGDGGKIYWTSIGSAVRPGAIRRADLDGTHVENVYSSSDGPEGINDRQLRGLALALTGVKFGACCTADGTCLPEELEADCIDMGGVYQGDDTVCESGSCVAPAGACCFIDGTCLDEQAESDCTNAGGTYQGDDTTCTPNPCVQPTGACCVGGLTCTVETQSDCSAISGVYEGNFTICELSLCRLTTSPSGPAGSIISWVGDNAVDIVPPSGDDFVAIARGFFNHGVALRADGSLVVFGTGPGTVGAPTAEGPVFAAIAAGMRHGLALRRDGSLVSWGQDEEGVVSETPTGNDFRAIAANENHSIAIRANGTLIEWGEEQGTPQCPLPTESNFRQVAAGYDYNVALTDDGRLVGWGTCSEVNKVPSDNGYVAADADWAAGGLGLKTDGSIVGWGDFIGTIPPGTGYQAVSAGFGHGTVIAADGSLVSFGGLGPPNNPAAPPAGTNYVAVSSGQFSYLAIAAAPMIGACCLADGPMCSDVSGDDCVAVGGVHAGKGTSCAMTVCCLLPGDINGDGVVAADDISGFVRAKLGEPAGPGENPACANYDSGSTEGDVSLFVAALID